MLVRHYSLRTINTDIYWIHQYLIFHHKQHHHKLYSRDVEQFLTHWSVNRNVTSATQAMALNALAFLYNKFLHQSVGDFGDFRHAARPRKLPTVLTLTEVSLLLQQLRGRDVDFQFSQLHIWQGKGMKHRLVTLAPELHQPIRYQIQQVKQHLQRDLAEHHYCGVFMPTALDKKYPNVNKQLPWQYLFPAHQLSLEPGTNKLRRHHVHETMCE